MNWQNLPTGGPRTTPLNIDDRSVTASFLSGYNSSTDGASLFAAAPRAASEIEFCAGWLARESDEKSCNVRAFHNPAALAYQKLLADNPGAVVVEFSPSRKARVDGEVVTWNKKRSTFFRLLAPAAEVRENIFGAKYLSVLRRTGFRALYLAVQIENPDRDKIHAAFVAGKARWMVDRGLLPPENILSDR